MAHQINYNWKNSTLALHAGEETKFADAHVTPIFATSTFSFPDADIGRLRFAGSDDGFIYTRLGNPTVQAAEKKIASLEGIDLLRKGKNVEGHAFSTGMATIASSLLALTNPNDVILATNPVYGGTNYLMNGILKNFEVKTKFIKTGGEEGIENVKQENDQKIKILFLESPANPNLCVSDIEELTKIAKERNWLVIV
ncbi:MAG: aminotransferase class I/II-fold pyridoxal phosphate-dependent enzyme, partial [Candidatus Thorarchaeota archaeon]